MYSIKSVDAAMSNALFRNRNEGFAAYHEGNMHGIDIAIVFSSFDFNQL